MRNQNPKKLRIENLEERTLLVVWSGSEIDFSAAVQNSTDNEEIDLSSIKNTAGTTWIVNSLSDSADWDTADTEITLREAVAGASEGDRIVFDSSLANQTITLNGGELQITKEITIDASSIGGITINADKKSRVFSISCGTEETPVKLISLTITGGDIGGFGGGIYVYSNSTLALINCTISGNASSMNEDTAYSGGGIFADTYSTLTLTNCTIADNYSSDNGGGIYAYSGSAIILTNCIIAGNFASCGGGILTYYCSAVTLTNCTIAGNKGFVGGGIDNANSPLTLTNCTIAGNIASFGGGISTKGLLTIYNSIIVQNTVSKSGSDIDKNSGTLTACNTLSSFTDWTESESTCIYDPTKPLFTSSETGDYTLAENSQAVDKGNNAYVTADTDLLGNPRIVNSIVDLGAYEYASQQKEITDVSLIGWSGPYDGESHTVTLIDPQAETDTIVYSYNGLTYRCAPTFTEIGTYTVSVKVSRDGYADWKGSANVEIKPTSIDTPTITTGTKGNYVSYGSNRHFIQWSKINTAANYELSYSADGKNWKTITTSAVNAVITGLTYGADIQYKVRALTSTQTSDWSRIKTFNVCPMDINNDGGIAGPDRSLLASSWLSCEGEEEFIYACDINGDGSIAGPDRNFLASNWLCEAGDDDLVYPKAITAADTAIAEFVSEFAIDLSIF